MWSERKTAQVEILLRDDVPARIIERYPGAVILAHGHDPVWMPQDEEDPFPASSVLSDAPHQREGDVCWELAIVDEGEIIALASFSESIAGPREQYYSLTLDKIFVHPDHRGRGFGSLFVALMGDVFRERIVTISTIDPSCSYMSCEPASEGGEALADKMTDMRRMIQGEMSQETGPAP